MNSQNILYKTRKEKTKHHNFTKCLRSYKSYENDEKKQGSLKYKYILEKLSEINPIDEEHGIIDIEYITEKC